jgi:hypothetical protein
MGCYVMQRKLKRKLGSMTNSSLRTERSDRATTSDTRRPWSRTSTKDHALPGIDRIVGNLRLLPDPRNTDVTSVIEVGTALVRRGKALNASLRKLSARSIGIWLRGLRRSRRSVALLPLGLQLLILV